MSENPEAAYAEEAQEEILELEHEGRRRRDERKKNTRSTALDDGDNWNDESETSPLISRSTRPRTQARGVSYQKAIDEPWTGAHGKGDLPWYKKPSVSTVLET